MSSTVYLQSNFKPKLQFFQILIKLSKEGITLNYHPQDPPQRPKTHDQPHIPKTQKPCHTPSPR